MSDSLQALARRAEGEAFFLASLLAAYALTEGLDDTGLATALGCSGEDLTMLRLCRAPRSAAEEFWDDVLRIAERFRLEPGRLAEVVKRGSVVRRLQSAPPAGGFLMAARDRIQPVEDCPLTSDPSPPQQGRGEGEADPPADSEDQPRQEGP
jgi:hypothetical protein